MPQATRPTDKSVAAVHRSNKRDSLMEFSGEGIGRSSAESAVQERRRVQGEMFVMRQQCVVQSIWRHFQRNKTDVDKFGAGDFVHRPDSFPEWAIVFTGE